MKKFLLLLFPILLMIVFIACDFSSEDTLSDNNSSEQSTESSLAPDNESSENDDSSEPDDNSDTSDPSAENSDTSITDPDPNEIIDATLEGISVSVIGASELENAGYKADSGFAKTVSVTVSGKRSIIENISASDITAAIDVSSISESGDIECMINFSLPDGVEYKSSSDSFATINITKKPTVTTPPVDPSAYISNGIVISGNRGMEQFGGGATAGEKTAANLNKFKEAVGADVNVYILPAPIASAYYAPDKYPNSIKNHVNCFTALKNALVDVEYVDVLGALSTHTDEEIYFRTDHHWQALGAYYAAEELAKVAGTTFDNISTFQVESYTGVVGSLYTYSKASILKENPDTIVWYVPTREHTVTYYSVDKCTNPITGRTLFSSNKGYTKFIYGDSYTTHIKSDVNNGRKLLIFKDSFGNALAPFVLSSFEEVYIADYREFKLNAVDFIEEHGITDVCFAMAAFSVAGSKRDYITKLLDY